MKLNTILQKLIPFTIVTSRNIHAKTPGYIREIFRFNTKRKVWVIGRKIKNINDVKLDI